MLCHLSSFLNFRSHKALEGVLQWKNLPRTQFIWWFLFFPFFPLHFQPEKNLQNHVTISNTNHLQFLEMEYLTKISICVFSFWLIKKTFPTFIKNDNYIFFTALSFLRSIFQFGFFWNVYNRKRCTILFVVSFYLCWMLCIPCLYTYSVENFLCWALILFLDYYVWGEFLQKI